MSEKAIEELKILVKDLLKQVNHPVNAVGNFGDGIADERQSIQLLIERHLSKKTLIELI